MHSNKLKIIMIGPSGVSISNYKPFNSGINSGKLVIVLLYVPNYLRKGKINPIFISIRVSFIN